MYKGQHIYIKKAYGSYTHHALGIGDNKVIHYSGLANNDVSVPGVIEEICLEEFAQEKEIHIKPHPKRKHSIDEAIIRASLRLGEAQYHVLHNNCEHFVEWCISGKHKSSQSQRGKLIYSAGIGVRVLIGAKNPIGFIAGATAAYAYIHRQGMNKLPNFERLEETFLRKTAVEKTNALAKIK